MLNTRQKIREWFDIAMGMLIAVSIVWFFYGVIDLIWRALGH